MKKIKLSYNQAKKVLWDNKEVRKTHQGIVIYIYKNYDGIVECKDWTGRILHNISLDTSAFDL